MKDLFYMGGPLFMSILSILFLLILVYSVINLLTILNRKNGDVLKLQGRIAHIKSIGLFTMITGILGQLIGLYMAFAAIENAMDISPAIMAGGLKVSMITTMYGIVIYLISLLIWFLLDLLAGRKG